jgi:carboxymethylenebutenolidase
MQHLLRIVLFASIVSWMTTALPAAEIKSADIMIKSGDEQIKAFLAEPVGEGPFPGIVVIQEWWGLNDWVKDQAKRLAEQGYVAIAPDLYRGKITADPKIAGQLLKGLPDDRALGDLRAAVDELVSHKNVKLKIGAIGWCMGGGFALKMALADKRVHACVICYGRLVTEADGLKTLSPNASVLGIFGEEDKGIPPAQVKAFEVALKEAGKKSAGIHIFPAAGHGFMRDMNKNPAYKADDTKKAWALIEAYFAKTLK